MPPTRPKSDITIRGGVINIAASTAPTRPLRHQPDTPRTKKTVKVKTDHQVYGAHSSITVKDKEPPPPTIADESADDSAADSQD